MRLNSLAVRLLVGAGVWVIIALAAGGVVLSSLFRSYVETSFDNRLDVVLESLIAASAVEPSGLKVTHTPEDPRFTRPYSGWYWQIQMAEEAVARSRSLWDEILPRPAALELGKAIEIDGPLGQPLRALAREIRLPDTARPLVYIVAADPAEIEAEVARFNATLSWSLGVLGVVLIAAVLLQVLFGLQPLRRLQRRIADIRAGRAARLDENLPVEIAPVAHELNALLDHNAEVVERARTHVGNLAHALKTPLAVLANEAAASGGVAADAVRRQTELMRRQIDHYLVRARAAGSGRVLGSRSDVAAVLDDLVRTLGKIHAGRGLRMRVEVAPGATFRGERQDLDEMLGNLIDNACKWARSEVAIAAAVEGRRLRVLVDDDGPGLPAERRSEVLHRGTRLDESVPGSGLGLAIVRDMAGLYGGSLRLDRAPAGGLRASVELPAAEPPGRS